LSGRKRHGRLARQRRSSRFLLINDANAANVHFQVGSSASLGTTSESRGRILALTGITLNTGASINCGAALARNGAVNLYTNVIAICLAAASVSVGTRWAARRGSPPSGRCK
jgi:hypothetical protein